MIHRAASLTRLRGGGALAAALGISALCGPLVDAAVMALFVAIFHSGDLAGFFAVPLRTLLVAYVLGGLPSAIVGLAAGFAPFARLRTYLPMCAGAGLLSGIAEVLVITAVASADVTPLDLVQAGALVGGTGAVSGLACGALIRWFFRAAARPPNVADAFG